MFNSTLHNSLKSSLTHTLTEFCRAWFPMCRSKHQVKRSSNELLQLKPIQCSKFQLSTESLLSPDNDDLKISNEYFHFFTSKKVLILPLLNQRSFNEAKN